MDAGASIDASATQNGDGGKVVLWSDIQNATSQTRAYGTILAEGGALGGNGGRVETSGRYLDINGARVSTLAAGGRVGNWLLDPGNVTIANSGGGSIPGAGGPSSDTVISGNTIITALNSTDVTITTGATGDFNLTVQDGFSYTGSSERTLTLGASGNLYLNSNISATNAKLNLILVSEIDRDASSIGQNGRGVALSGPINTNGGDLWVGSGQLTGSWNGRTVGTGAAMGGASNQIGIEGKSTIDTGGGNIRLVGDSGSGIGVGIASYQGNITINAGSGNVEFITNIFDFKYQTETSSIIVNTTGSFTIAPLSTSFNTGVVWNPGLSGSYYTAGTDAAGYITGLSVPNTLSAFTIGKAGNTQDITVSSALTMPGGISLIGGNINLNGSLTTTAAAAALTARASGSLTVNGALSSAGDITLAATGTDVLVNQSITTTGASAKALSIQANRNIRLGPNASVTATGGAMNTELWADTGADGDGINFIESAGITTNGGSLAFGRSGQTATIGGVSGVRVGGDVFFQRGSTQTLSTGGGALNVYGETIVSNTSGLAVNTANGDVNLWGLLNSGNQYTFVSQTSGGSWDAARTAAINGTGGAAPRAIAT